MLDLHPPLLENVILKLIYIFVFVFFMLQRLTKFVSSNLYWDFFYVVLCCRAVLMWLRWKKVNFFNFVILKLICIFVFMPIRVKKNPFRVEVVWYSTIRFPSSIVVSGTFKIAVFTHLTVCLTVESTVQQLRESKLLTSVLYAPSQ